MASSGDYSWNSSTYQIITGALRLLSAIQTGEEPPADEFTDALSSLNGLITHWQASGIHVWSEVECILFLQPNQRSYRIGSGTADHICAASDWMQTYLTATAAAAATSVTVAATTGMDNAILNNDWIGVVVQTAPQSVFWTRVSGVAGNVVSLAAGLPAQAATGSRVLSYTTDLVRPLKIPAARRLVYAGNNGVPGRIETPTSIYSRLDYGAVPNKDTPGEVTAFFYDPQLGQGIMNVWPSPVDANQGLTFTAQRPLQDFTSQRDNADLPVEWISTLRYNLAVELAPEYDITAERFQMIKLMAGEKLETCKGWDREPESVYFGLQQYPAMRNA